MSKTINRIGIDVGTYSIATARIKDEKLEVKKEINCFYPIELNESNKFLINMLKQSGAPVVEVDGVSYVLGESARALAVSMGKEFHRPMKNGIVNPEEKSGFNILAVIIRSLLGELTADETIVYFSMPGQSLNVQTSPDYHQKVVQSILDKYKQGDKTVRSYPINEAMCVVYSELQSKNRTGIGLSFGGGQTNCAYSLMGFPLVQFSHVNAGDWIDFESAKNSGESVSYVNEYKKNIDLSQEPKNVIERALHFNYEIMIENALKGVIDGLTKAGSKANPGGLVDIALAGGTASVAGFTDFFRNTLAKHKFPIPIGEVKIGSEPILSVCKGALLAAEAHQD